MTLFSHVKPVILGAAIVLGLFAQAKSSAASDQAVLTVAGGCFWCVEADFERVKGVTEVVSGYTGGTVPNPTYKQVVRGGTGHIEAVQIHYDPSVVSARQLYDLFFRSVDPTDAGGQFCDRGESYQTAIFATAADKADATAAKAAAQAALGQSIVTPIREADTFYTAEDYHQDYYRKTDIILTRFGPLSKAKAYKRYRTACGRDARVKELWGSDAPFVGS